MQISEQIKEKIDVVEFISGFIKLNKAGANFKGLCPFHKEKTPSFMVSSEKQIWHCFGCNEGGDIFKFLMKYENLEFLEALKILAKRAGVELKKQDPKLQSELSRLYEICFEANNFFRENLKKNSLALDYLEKRGLRPETIEMWQLGFIENKFDVLFNHLRDLGFKPEEIARAGMVFQSARDKNKYFDRFRGRIIFPIFDNSGRIAGFTGRIFGREENEKEPKYLNSPESIIFNKRNILYGYFHNKKEIREKGEVVLAEGQMDVIVSWQNGLKNIVASSGTALTQEQLKTLKRTADNLIIGYDMDEAGRMAAERAIDLAKQLDFNVYIVTLPADHKDLADYFLANSNQSEDLLRDKKDAGEYYFARAFFGLEKKDMLAKNKAVEFFLEKLSGFADPLQRDYWLKKTAHDLNISEVSLREKLGQIIKSRKNFSLGPKQEEKSEFKIFKKSRKDFLAEILLSLSLKEEKLKEKLNLAKEYFDSEKKNIAEAIVLGKDISAEKKEKIGYLSLLSSYEFGEKEIDWEEEFDLTFQQLKKEILKEKIDQKNLEIKQAESLGNKDLLAQKLQELQDLAKELEGGK